MSFTESQLDEIFNRTTTPTPNLLGIRRTQEGHLVLRGLYGKHEPFGWQVDHCLSQALGGTNHPNNLRARQTHANESAGGLLGAVLNS